MRRTCECCNQPLPPEFTAALICSFECTFCSRCCKNTLRSIYPNCGGELVRCPRRPPAKLENFPASAEVVYKLVGCAQAVV